MRRLAEDHDNAARLAAGLRAIGLATEPPQTNMLFVDIPDDQVAALGAHLAQRGVLASVSPRTRLVTHLDVSRDDIETTVRAFREYPGWST